MEKHGAFKSTEPLYLGAETSGPVTDIDLARLKINVLAVPATFGEQDSHECSELFTYRSGCKV